MPIIDFLFSRQGRFARAHWWAALVFWGVILGLVSKLLGSIFAFEPQQCATRHGASVTTTVCVSNWRVLFPYLSVLVIISIPPMVKRLHDRGRGDVWAYVYLALALLPLAALSLIGADVLVESSGPVVWLAIAAVLLSLVVWLAVAIDLGFLRGTNGPNAYGEEATLFGRAETAGT